MLSQLWYEIGFIRWPLALAWVAVLILSAWSAVKLFRPSAYADHRTKAWVDAILFWGGFALICGVAGTLVGTTLAFQSIERAGEVSPTLVAGGIKVALLSSMVGMLLLIIASLSWFALQLRWRLLVADELDA